MVKSAFQSDATGQNSSLAKTLAPEDVRAGDYVTVLHEICELPSFFWCCDAALTRREELVRLQVIPKTSGVPLKVKSICLPFVLVKHPNGSERPLDLRQCRLARLDRAYARAAWKTQKPRTSRKRRRRK